MDIFFALSVGVLALILFFLSKNPRQWQQYIIFVPLAGFLICGRMYGITPDAWHSAFIFAGFCAIFVFIVLFGQQTMHERLMLGVNVFFLFGAYGFLSGNDSIVRWYSESSGGPLFFCIALVGLLTLLFTKPGFIGVKHKSKQAVQYASFLLLAATVIALIWSIQSEEHGIFLSVVVPFLALYAVREGLIRQMD